MPGGVTGEDGHFLEVAGETVPVNGEKSWYEHCRASVIWRFNPRFQQEDQELANKLGWGVPPGVVVKHDMGIQHAPIG